MSKYDKVMMQTAYLFAEESYCKRKKVGAILATNDRIRSVGYNGTIKGKPNNCEEEYFQCDNCFGRNENISELATPQKQPLSINPFDDEVFDWYCKKCHKKMENIEKKFVTNDFTLHAEQNALTDAASQGISTQGATMYVTLAPCKMCAKLMVQAGIKRIVYAEGYRDMSGIEFLKSCNVDTSQLNINRGK